MAAPLASTTFNSGPRNELATQDVYKVGNERVVNSIQDITKAPDTTQVNRLTGATVKGMVKDAFTLLRVVGTLKDSRTSLLNKVLAGSGVLGEGLRRSGLPTDMLTNAMSTVKSLNSTYVTMGSSIQRIKNGNFTNIAGITNGIGIMTGQQDTMKAVSDNLTSGAVGGMIKLASQNGVNGSFEQFTRALGNNPRILNNVIDQALPTAIQRSDTGMLREMATAVPGFQKASNPNIINDLSANYKPNYKPLSASAARELEQAWKDVTWTMTKVDSKWDTAERVVDNTPVQVSNTTAIVEASPEFKEAMRHSLISKSDKTQEERAMLISANMRRRQELADKTTITFPTTDADEVRRRRQELSDKTTITFPTSDAAEIRRRRQELADKTVISYPTSDAAEIRRKRQELTDKTIISYPTSGSNAPYYPETQYRSIVLPSSS